MCRERASTLYSAFHSYYNSTTSASIHSCIATIKEEVKTRRRDYVACGSSSGHKVFSCKKKPGGRLENDVCDIEQVDHWQQLFNERTRARIPLRGMNGLLRLLYARAIVARASSFSRVSSNCVFLFFHFSSFTARRTRAKGKSARR